MTAIADDLPLPSRRFSLATAIRRNPTIAFGGLLLLLLVAVAIVGPSFVADPMKIAPVNRLRPPSERWWFGTDQFGRDLFARTVWGSRVSLIVGLSVATFSSIVGLALGLACGYFRRLDGIVMRVMDGLMAIPSILLAIAVPSFRDFILNQRRTAAINEVILALQTARGEALKRAQTVTVCPSTNGTACSSTSTDWGSGWLTYVVSGAFTGTPPATCGASRPDTLAACGDVILNYSTNDYPGIAIKSNIASYDFRPFNVHTTAGTITVCDPRTTADSTKIYGIVVSTIGRTRVAKYNDPNVTLTCP